MGGDCGVPAPNRRLLTILNRAQNWPMAEPTVVFAGREFPAAPELLRAQLPETRIVVVDRSIPATAGEILIPLMARVDGAAMDRVAGLRVIQQWGAGLEGVDLAAATERHLAVGNVATTETGNAESVAEWCVMAALALSRNLGEVHASIRNGTAWGGPIGHSIAGATAGIVGLGGIGTALAERLRPFAMDLIGVTSRPDPEQGAEFGMRWLRTPDRLPELLAEAAYVFLCLPLRPESRGLIDAAALAQMRRDGYLINAGRGGLVDEAALINALQTGRIAGAALDVFASEPLDPSSELLSLPNVLATPHIAGVTERSYQGNAERVATVVRKLATSAPLSHCVNWPQLAERFYA